MTQHPEIIFSTEAIAQRVDVLAVEIAARLPRECVVVSLLKGGFMFTADLVRAMHRVGMAPILDFLTLSSYGEGTESSGQVRLVQDIVVDVAGKHVLMVDDILESGRTLTHARAHLLTHGAASVAIAVLLEKPGKRTVEIVADYVGFSVPDRFLVGYGLDHAHRYRELPYIGAL